MYIHRPLRKSLWTAAILAGIGLTVLAGYAVQKRDERKEIAEYAARQKVAPLIDTVDKLQKAVTAYQAKMGQLGEVLPEGRVISIEDLLESRVLRKEDLGRQIEIEKFAYILLPDDAADSSLKMLVVTNKGRFTVNKKGQGAMYDR